MENDDLGEINIQNFQSIIDNYETIVQDLTNGLDASKVEQSNLKLRINDLLDENRQLTEKLKETNGKGDSPNGQQDLMFIENLKNELDFVNKEKESIMGLWRNSLDTINHLEDELKYYEGSNVGFIPKGEVYKMKNSFEQKIKKLEEELNEVNTKYETAVKTSSEELEIRNKDIIKAVSAQHGTFEIVSNLEDEIKKLQERLKATQEIRDSLEEELGFCKDKIEILRKEKLDCCAKVSEAVQVVEAALNEKDAALLREKVAQEEIEKLNATLSEIIEEAGQKVKNEVEAVKKDYNNKLKVLLLDLKAVQNEVKAKEIEIERYVKETAELKREIERLQRFHPPSEETTTKFITLEKTLESTFQKLVLSEKRNVQLEAEKENLKADLDQMANHYERDIKARDVEKVTLQIKIKNLQAELDETQAKFVVMSEKMETLNKEIKATEKEFKEQIALKESTLTNSHKQVDEKNSVLLLELQKHVEAQIKMNQKWKTESKNIIDKLQNHLVQANNELAMIKKENKHLREKVNQAKHQLRDYKKMVNTISKDLGKITDTVFGGSSLVKKIDKNDR